MTTNEQKKHNASVRRKFLAVHRDYRRWQHDQRMMWFRENDGSNQCIPPQVWLVLGQRLAA